MRNFAKLDIIPLNSPPSLFSAPCHPQTVKYRNENPLPCHPFPLKLLPTCENIGLQSHLHPETPRRTHPHPRRPPATHPMCPQPHPRHFPRRAPLRTHTPPSPQPPPQPNPQTLPQPQPHPRCALRPSPATPPTHPQPHPQPNPQTLPQPQPHPRCALRPSPATPPTPPSSAPHTPSPPQSRMQFPNRSDSATQSDTNKQASQGELHAKLQHLRPLAGPVATPHGGHRAQAATHPDR